MKPIEPAMTNLRNRITKQLGEPGNLWLNLSKKQYKGWLEDRLRKAESIDEALAEAMRMIEATDEKEGAA